jgi:hypothetical protein
VARTLMDQPQEHVLRILVIQNKLKSMELGRQLGPQSCQIHPSIQTKSRNLEVYSYLHFAP